MKRTKHECQKCLKICTRQSNLKRHLKKACTKQYPRKYCNEKFKQYSDLFKHVNTNHPLRKTIDQSQTCEGNVQGNELQQDMGRTKDTAALYKAVNKHVVHPLDNDEKYDLLTFFTNMRADKVNNLRSSRKQLNHIKYNINAKVQMTRQKDADTTETAEPHFRSKTNYLLTEEDVNEEHHLNAAFQNMLKTFDEFIRKGSSWTLKKIYAR